MRFINPVSGLTFAESLEVTPAELRRRFATFATDVAKFAKPLLRQSHTYDAARQLIRSSASAADNHRAAGRARSHAEFTARIGVALDEADEAKSWLKYLQNSEFVSAELIRPYHSEGEQLVAILTASYKTARQREGKDWRRPNPRASRRPRRSRSNGNDGTNPHDDQ